MRRGLSANGIWDSRFGDDQWTDPLKDGPLEHGFDYYFGISASLDMPPFVYIENDRVTEVPSVEKKWVRSGPAAKDFEAVDVLPKLTEKAKDYIAKHAGDAKQTGAEAKPFFLYLAFTSPHTPIVPTPEWQGKSGLGPYGDFVMETDWATGEVLKAIDEAGLKDDTLVVFASDNGCSPAAKVADLEAQGHYPSAQFRGYKADIWDGGHRIPFIVRWPGKVKAGSSADTVICLTDFMATCAELVGETLPANAAEDSVSMLPILLSQTGGQTHEAIVHHSINGNFAIRKGNWKLELCAGSGGWGAPREAEAIKEKLPPEQLYDMSSDEGEQHNVAAEHPEVVKELTALLQKYIDDGRSTEGARQKNDAQDSGAEGSGFGGEGEAGGGLGCVGSEIVTRPTLVDSYFRPGARLPEGNRARLLVDPLGLNQIENRLLSFKYQRADSGTGSDFSSWWPLFFGGRGELADVDQRKCGRRSLWEARRPIFQRAKLQDGGVGLQHLRFDLHRFGLAAGDGHGLLGFEFFLGQQVLSGQRNLLGSNFGFDRLIEGGAEFEVDDVQGLGLDAHGF